MRTHGWIGVFFLCLLCLGGCGKEKAPADSRQASENIGTPGNAEVLGDVNWEKGFSVSDTVEEETALWAARYDRWTHEDIHRDFSAEGFLYERQAMIQGEQIYRLCSIYPQEESGEVRDLLEIYDISSGQVTLCELDNEKLGTVKGAVASMYVAETGKYVFCILNEQNQVNKIVYSDLGEQTQTVDVLPACQEKGIADQLSYECICDAEGNIYIRDNKWRALYVFDREGSLLMEYQGEESDNIRPPFTMPSGELIFPIYNSEEKVCRLVRLDTEQKKEHIVSSFESYPIESVYGVQGNDIYYEAWEGIVKWDISSGERTLVYAFDQDCISRRYRTMLVLREGQAPVLRMYGTVNGEAEDWLVTLVEETVKPRDTVRVAGLTETSFDLRGCASTAFRKYRNNTFVYETYEKGGKEDYRTGIFAELAAGGGPDILFVSLQDMRLLQEQGYLRDLRSILSQDYLNRILLNVIQLGTVNDTLTGLAPLMSTNTAVTLREVWNPDTWTLEDLMDLMEEGEFTEIFCQGFSGAFCQMNLGCDSESVIRALTEFGLENSALVDWEIGESHFNSELFNRMLYMAKNYSGVPFGQEIWLGVGGCPVKLGGLALNDFNELYDQYGEDYHVTGLPTGTGNNSYLSCEGVLVVNAASLNLDAVVSFFECLLRDEFQNVHLLNTSILKISPEDIEYREEGGERKAYWKDQELRIKEDGTTTFDDYAAYLESCVPSPIIAEEDIIKSIVWEEAEAYINGDKSAEEVAGIIHSRVQLYLDENKIKNK